MSAECKGPNLDFKTTVRAILSNPSFDIWFNVIQGNAYATTTTRRRLRLIASPFIFRYLSCCSKFIQNWTNCSPKHVEIVDYIV